MISIIVPAYNSEKTIRRCIESLMQQTCRDFEAIIVDDGSTDDSARVCKELIVGDDRFKIVSMSNGGPSSARNKGIDICKGDYVAFLDSDDYLASDYLEKVQAIILNESPDAVFISFARVNEKGEIITKHILSEPIAEYYKSIISLSQKDMFGYTWAKIIKIDLIGDIRFDESLDLMEDEVFSCMVFEKPCKISFIYTPIYNYVIGGQTSLSRKTHQDYAIKCDAAYKAWKRLLAITGPNTDTGLLGEKAKHFHKLCYYYAMERDIKLMPFCKQLAECEFVKEWNPIEDEFYHLIQKKAWPSIMLKRVAYKLKNKLLRHV